jgi:hypothetical protein
MREERSGGKRTDEQDWKIEPAGAGNERPIVGHAGGLIAEEVPRHPARDDALPGATGLSRGASLEVITRGVPESNAGRAPLSLQGCRRGSERTMRSTRTNDASEGRASSIVARSLAAASGVGDTTTRSMFQPGS